MSVRVWIVVLCFATLGLTKVRLITADTRVGFDSVMNKLNYIQDKLEDVEQNVNRMKCNLQSPFAGPNTVDPGGKDKLEGMEILRDKLDALDAKMVSMEANILKILKGTGGPILNIRSCHKEPTKQSGAYFIKLGPNKDPFEVYCEQTAFGGGWIVFQHRTDGKVNFYRNWADYREGFGNINGEFWLGLEYVYQITSSRSYELMVEMRDYSGNYGYAHYDEFLIGNEGSNYYIQTLGKYQGTAGDGLSYNNGVQFSTFDRTNSGGSCASARQGAWWYNYCTYSNLNGAYKNVTSDWSSMSWYYFQNDYRGLVFSRMMIREKGADL